MTNFTPGPWQLDGECFSESGHYDAPRVFSHADPDVPRYVAEIAVSPQWEENGNLIAAAPEMYEALTKLRKDIQYWAENPRPDEWILQEWVRNIDRTLAKAVRP
jgi:hypothetical protein